VVGNKTGEEKGIGVDWIVLCVGTEPDTRLAREAELDIEGTFV